MKKHDEKILKYVNNALNWVDENGSVSDQQMADALEVPLIVAEKINEILDVLSCFIADRGSDEWNELIIDLWKL